MNRNEEYPGWHHTSKDGRITVYEGATAFWVVDNESGEERCAGDGVDRYFDDEGTALAVGTPGFYAALAEDIDTDTAAYIVAYFGDEEEDIPDDDDKQVVATKNGTSIVLMHIAHENDTFFIINGIEYHLDSENARTMGEFLYYNESEQYNH